MKHEPALHVILFYCTQIASTRESPMGIVSPATQPANRICEAFTAKIGGIA